MGLIETLTELIQNPTMLTSSRQYILFQKASFWVKELFKEPFIVDEIPKPLNGSFRAILRIRECFYFLVSLVNAILQNKKLA